MLLLVVGNVMFPNDLCQYNLVNLASKLNGY